jgi:hypothetical protein
LSFKFYNSCSRSFPSSLSVSSHLGSIKQKSCWTIAFDFDRFRLSAEWKSLRIRGSTRFVRRAQCGSGSRFRAVSTNEMAQPLVWLINEREHLVNWTRVKVNSEKWKMKSQIVIQITWFILLFRSQLSDNRWRNLVGLCSAGIPSISGQTAIGRGGCDHSSVVRAIKFFENHKAFQWIEFSNSWDFHSRQSVILFLSIISGRDRRTNRKKEKGGSMDWLLEKIENRNYKMWRTTDEKLTLKLKWKWKAKNTPGTIRMRNLPVTFRMLYHWATGGFRWLRAFESIGEISDDQRRESLLVFIPNWPRSFFPQSLQTNSAFCSFEFSSSQQ